MPTYYASPQSPSRGHMSGGSLVCPEDLDTAGPEERRSKRRSRSFNLSRQKVPGQTKKRKSWFGDRQAAEDAPAVPALPPMSPVNSSQAQPREIGASGEFNALMTDDVVSWSHSGTPQQSSTADKRKSRRLSFGGKILASMKRRETVVEPVPQLQKQQSVRGGLRDVAPTLTASQPTVRRDAELVDEDTERIPALAAVERGARRRSLRAAFGRPRSKSMASTKSKRRSWWESSNPDLNFDDEHGEDFRYDAPPLPPLPQLVQDEGRWTPATSVANTASPDYSNLVYPLIVGDQPVHHVTRAGTMKQPRPLSGVSLSSRRKYRPKSAASGFMATVGGRSSQRHSLMEDGENGIVLLSDEQQKEWDKLKNLMETLERRENKAAVEMLRQFEDEEEYRNGVAYSNAQALAALEFGTDS